MWTPAVPDVLYPAFGLSQVLHSNPLDLPPDIESTVSDLEFDHLLKAGAALCQVLSHVSALAARRRGCELSLRMERYVHDLFVATLQV